MKINIAELSGVAIESTTNSVKMRLSEHAQSMVFQLFTKNVYSNPIGTIVREITSNCFDSHIEAKVNAPVIIRKSFDNDANTHYISFIDFGVGMSPDRVMNIYGVYFESTKRTDNEQIGGFGIGAKSCLAYKRSTGAGEGEYDNSFYVITNYNGTRYYYCIYEGTTSPEISLLHEEVTEERNGTEIRIPVLSRDIDTFAKEMVRQLYYFENIIFEGFDDTYKSAILTNNYQILRGKTFLFRGEDYSNYAHICLGRVAYPIDYSVLGLNPSEYTLPIALRFDVGDINVTVSRESIDYSENTIKMLRKKLLEARAEITELLVKQYENIVTLEQYFNVKNEFGRLYFPNGSSMYIGTLIKQSDVNFSNFAYNVLKMPNDKQLFKMFFDVTVYGNKPQKRSRYGSKTEFIGGYKELKENDNLYYVEGKFNRKMLKQGYLKSLHKMYHVITKRDLLKSMKLFEVHELFNVHITNIVDPQTNQLDSFMLTLLNMQDEFFEIVKKHAADYDALEVPESYINDRKQQRESITNEMRKLTIPVRYFGGYNGRNKVILNALFEYRMPIFYGTPEDNSALENAAEIYKLLFDANRIVDGFSTYDKTFSHRNMSLKSKKSSIMFIQVSNVNVKYLKYCKNAHHISEVYWKLFHRKQNMVQSYFQTYNIISKYNDLANLYRDNDFSQIDANWGDKIKMVNAYINNIQNANKNKDLIYNRGRLSVYYKINDLPMSNEQKAISNMIDELAELERKNADVLRYIKYYETLKYNDGIVIDILKKLMTV